MKPEVSDALKVPTGYEEYKQTEIGLIPNDWDIVAIRNVCKLINGRGFKPYEWKKQGLPIIRIQNLNGSGEFNYYDGAYDKKIEVENGQLLFAWSGSRGTSFGPHLWKGSLGLLNYHTWKVRVNTTAIDANFFFHALKKLTGFIEDNAHGASALVHTQKWEMEGFLFPMPSRRAEQQAIGEALSDADELIESLEGLIAKKRAIKLGVMHELLSEKRRLPGFSGRWETRKLGDLGHFLKGNGVRKDQAQSGTLPCVRYGEIYTHHDYVLQHFRSHISREVAASATPIRQGDILFAGSGETKEEIGKCVALAGEVEAYAGGDIVILRTNNHDPVFLGYALNMPAAQRQKSTRGQGDAVVHISASALASVEVEIPKLPEQSAIATLLRNFDFELDVLEVRLEKMRQIKQGMTKELLTGRVRLI